jgi:hypothetical protein
VGEGGRIIGSKPNMAVSGLLVDADALGPAPRAELLHVLTVPDFNRVNSPLTAENGRATPLLGSVEGAR